jgi:hypothetical protein
MHVVAGDRSSDPHTPRVLLDDGADRPPEF